MRRVSPRDGLGYVMPADASRAVRPMSAQETRKPVALRDEAASAIAEPASIAMTTTGTIR